MNRIPVFSRSLRNSGEPFLLPLIALFAGIVGGWTFFLYREAVRLPLFFDDMVHLRWLDHRSLTQVWTTAEGLGYYRPLTMSVWKVSSLLLGRYDPALFHLYNLLLHMACGLLAAYLAWRLLPAPGRRGFALATALLFVAFPFSYQAVPSSSSLSKPLIGFLVMGSAALYWAGRRRGSRSLLVLSLLLGCAAPFAYENGVLVPILILTIEGMGWLGGEFRPLSWKPAIFAALIWGIALPVVISFEPNSGENSVHLASALSLWQNSVYFGQGLIFPIAPLTTVLHRWLGGDPFLWSALVEILTLGGLALFYGRVRQLRLFFFALIWFGVGIAPQWAVLEFSYVIDSPRVLYLAALGPALLWAGVPILLWTARPQAWWPKALTLIGLAAMLIFSANYVRQRMILATEMAEPLWQAVELATRRDDQERLLYLNVPLWIAPQDPTYLLGVEGLTFLPNYVRMRDFVYVNSGEERRITSALFDAAKKEWSSYLGYAGDHLDWQSLAQEIRTVTGVYRTRYLQDEMHFSYAGAVVDEEKRAPSVSQATFGDSLRLDQSQIQQKGSKLRVDLWWQSQHAVQEDVTLFLHVVDATGQIIGQGDGYPLLGLFPPLYWEAGERVHDVRYVRLTPDQVDESFSIVAGWYNTQTGQRLPAYDDQGTRLAQDSFLIDLRN